MRKPERIQPVRLSLIFRENLFKQTEPLLLQQRLLTIPASCRVARSPLAFQTEIGQRKSAADAISPARWRSSQGKGGCRTEIGGVQRNIVFFTSFSWGNDQVRRQCLPGCRTVRVLEIHGTIALHKLGCFQKNSLCSGPVTAFNVLTVRWKRYGDQYADDCNHDHQFDERKTSASFQIFQCVSLLLVNKNNLPICLSQLPPNLTDGPGDTSCSAQPNSQNPSFANGTVDRDRL